MRIVSEMNVRLFKTPVNPKRVTVTKAAMELSVHRVYLSGVLNRRYKSKRLNARIKRDFPMLFERYRKKFTDTQAVQAPSLHQTPETKTL